MVALEHSKLSRPVLVNSQSSQSSQSVPVARLLSWTEYYGVDPSRPASRHQNFQHFEHAYLKHKFENLGGPNYWITQRIGDAQAFGVDPRFHNPEDLSPLSKHPS